MNTLNTKVKQILSRYTCFTLPEDINYPTDFHLNRNTNTESDYALSIKKYIFLACYANTYATDEYVVVDSDNDNITKHLFIVHDDMPNENKFGKGMEKFPTCNISSSKFRLEGRGVAVAIFEKETLDIVQTYYFLGQSSLRLFAADNDMLVVVYNNHTYIQNYADYNSDFCLTINGTSECFGTYLVVYPDDPSYNYDYATSISLIDLNSKKEYILSKILKNLHINIVEAGSVNFNIKTQTLSFKDGENQEHKLDLNDIKKLCKGIDLDKKEDIILPGCCTPTIVGYK